MVALLLFGAFWLFAGWSGQWRLRCYEARRFGGGSWQGYVIALYVLLGVLPWLMLLLHLLVDGTVRLHGFLSETYHVSAEDR